MKISIAHIFTSGASQVIDFYDNVIAVPHHGRVETTDLGKRAIRILHIYFGKVNILLSATKKARPGPLKGFIVEPISTLFVCS